jgi:REP element-mobilizing transposase RayT
MPQSIARVNIHLIFSTKHRAPFITDDVRPALHRYLAATLREINCPSALINSVEDHVHILFELHRTITIAKAVEEIKKSSSKWLKTQAPALATFAWQSGYGAFSVSESNVDTVREYIARQQEHHQRKSFQDEYREFLSRHNAEFDERYVWD